MDTKEDLTALEKEWNDLILAGERVEGQMRTLLRSVPAPPLAETPRWLEQQVTDLQCPYMGSLSDMVALRTAARILRALLVQVPDLHLYDVELQLGPDNTVEILWPQHETMWRVYESRLPWPGIEVRSYTRRTSEGAKPYVQHFFLVDTLVAFGKSLTENNPEKPS